MPKGGAYSDVVEWQSDEYDAARESRAAKETDPAKRTQMYADADKMLVADEAVIAPLYWYADYRRSTRRISCIPRQSRVKTHYEFWDIQK